MVGKKEKNTFFFFVFFWLAMGWFCWLGTAHAKSPVAPEYRVKAALLLNLTRFIEWPKWAFKHNDKEIHICILGEDPFGDALATIQGKQSKGRKVVIFRKRQWHRSFSDCQLIFIASATKSRLAIWLHTLRSYPILTVSDIDGFAYGGGMIQIGTANRKASLLINVEATKRRGFEISTPLLELSTLVKTP